MRARDAKRRLAAVVAVVACLAAAGVADAACPQPASPPGYAARVGAALEAKQDLWGNRLLAARNGPTYEGARRYLRPLLFAGTAGQKPLTDSGVYYLPFGVPVGVRGATSVALHVADGSQIVSRRVGGSSVTVAVGGERYGSCLARLTPARLGGGWLPILQTRYVDSKGVRYAQESFATGAAPLVSFVRIAVDARRARGAATVRLTASPGGAGQLLAGGASRNGRTATWRIPRGQTRTVYALWVVRPDASRNRTPDAAGYDAARRAVTRYWETRLSTGMTIDVPERRVANAARALLVQNLLLTWRYSVGNPYEQFSWPEGVDVAQVLGEHGFADVAAAILRTSLTRSLTRYPNWKMGEKLLGSATHYALHRDRAYLDGATPKLRGYVTALGRQLTGSPRSLLDRERYSSDISDSVYGLHSQAVAWAGLRGMARAWEQTGHGALAATCRRLAARLEAGLRTAVRASQRRLPDGSLFVPVALLDGERPYGSLTEARLGSYWNLVMPYALASGLFPPGSAEARGVLRYLELHGSRLLGLVRAGAYALYGREAAFPVGGTDQVYGINIARFLADNDEADHLVLSLYGMLAAGMTPDTFVSGEAASVAPIPGASHRAMYLPPNGASNAAYLETLRLMLVHETRDLGGAPRGLRLAYSTPRGWLRPGGRVAVANAPTSFGPVSYSIDSGARSARIEIDVPSRQAPRSLTLRLRLPRGTSIARVNLAGRAYSRVDRATGTIDLSRLRGTIRLAVVYR